MNQSAPCCVLSLNMVKISSQFRLTTDSFSGGGGDGGGDGGVCVFVCVCVCNL